MADAPQGSPAPADSSDGLAALEATMAAAAEAANAQAAREEAGEPGPAASTTTTEPADPAAAATHREPSDEDQAGEDTSAEAQDDGGDQASASPDPTTPPEQRYSRKDAPRLAKQVEDLSRELESVRVQAGERDRTDAAALSQFAHLVKTPEQYADLQRRAIAGDWQAKQELEVADAWRKMAAPVFALAQRQADEYVGKVQSAYAGEIHSLRTLDGFSDEAIKQVTGAQSPGQALRAAYETGRTAAEQASKGQIADLKTRIADLERQLGAKGPQPAGTNGSLGSGPLSSYVRADGTLPEDVLDRALRGELMGVGASPPA